MILGLATSSRRSNRRNTSPAVPSGLARKIRCAALTLAIALLSPLLAWSQPTQSAEAAWSQDSQLQDGQALEPGHATSPNFQGLILHWFQPWPTVTFHTFRLWDTGTRWAQLNPSSGQFDWTMLDHWLTAAQQTGDNPLFTLGMTPQWASSRPDDKTCRYSPGECDPPDDLNADGSGTDQHWKDFITAIVTHANGRIHHWEVWNEPQAANAWTGTHAQLVRMAQDARAIIQSVDPTSKMLNGGVEMHNGIAMKWWAAYAAAGGLQYADILAIHGDVRTFPEICGVYPVAENFVPLVQGLRVILTQYHQSGKPIWDTEASWGQTNLDCFNNQDLQAAFLARFYLIQLSENIQRFYWRGWIDKSGGLYNPETGLNKAGKAYGQMHNWLLGNTLTNACSAKGTIWTCDFTGPKGYKGQAVWDTLMSCKHGSCRTAEYIVDSQFRYYLTLDGHKEQIVNNKVLIGAKPIWLEN